MRAVAPLYIRASLLASMQPLGRPGTAAAREAAEPTLLVNNLLDYFKGSP